jgi:hypothetical protein
MIKPIIFVLGVLLAKLVWQRVTEEELATVPEEPQNNGTTLCVVCLDAEKNTVLLPCRHLCLCSTCAQIPELVQCPLCRSPVESRLEVYL